MTCYAAKVIMYYYGASYKIMNSTPPLTKVHAHRVLNRNGELSGKHHFNPPGKMQESLEKEGLKIVDDKVKNSAASFWDPNKELI